MDVLKQIFLVTIEIDPIRARPCNCGNKANTFPDWIWKYQNREQKFINNIWDEFRSCFKYDGLNCSVVAIEKKQFSGIYEPDNGDKLSDIQLLIEQVYDNIYPEVEDPPAKFEEENIQECDQIFTELTATVQTAREYVERMERLRER